MGIDYGMVRTGIAVTDAGGRMAFPRRTITLPPQGRKEGFWIDLLTLIEEEAPAALVVGLPLPADGGESLTTRQVRNFVDRLRRRVSLPVHLMPEFLSSAEAESHLREAGVRRERMREALDQQAAVRILESFLAERRLERSPT